MEKLKANGLSDEEIETLLYFHPAFFCKRVERVVLPPQQLYWHVCAVFVKFGTKVDSKTGSLYSTREPGQRQAMSCRRYFLVCTQTLLASTLYELDGDGNPKTDKYGCVLIKCNQGTNDVENFHRYYHIAFQYGVGFEMGDYLLAQRWHCHNV